MYSVLLVVHIVAAVVGFGPPMLGPILLAQVRKDPESLRILGPIMGKIGLFPKVGGVVQIVTGLGMVGLRDWGLLAQPWVYLSLGLVVVANIVAHRGIDPLGRELGMMVRSGTITAEKVNATADKIERFSRINGLILLAILLLMVLKP